MEFSKRFTTKKVWPDAALVQIPEMRDKFPFDVLFETGRVDKNPLSGIAEESTGFGFYVQKACLKTRPMLDALKGMILRI